MTSTDEEKFDPILLSIAQQHTNGIEELLDTFFGFLRRKTDFFSKKDQANQVILKSFENQCKKYEQQIDKAKEKEREEAKRTTKVKDDLTAKQKRDEELRLQSIATGQKIKPSIVEIEDEPEVKPEPAKPEPAKPVATATKTLAPESSTSANKQPEASQDGESKGASPNSGNGGQTDKYVWYQTLSEVEVKIPVTKGTTSKQLNVEFTKTNLKISYRAKPNEPIIEGVLHKNIQPGPGDSFWTLEDNELINLHLQKTNAMEWWKTVIQGDPEIDTQKVQPENSKLEDLDRDTRGTVEKLMYDQRQKSMGLPTSDEMEKQNKLNQFMAAHPEMDFSKAKFC